MKAVLQYRASPGFAAIIEQSRGAVAVAIVDEDDAAAFMREIADAAVLLHVLKPVTAQMMDAAPQLKLIQKIGVGVNTIDLDAARARGIAVCNMPGTNSQAVAELTMGLMLGALRQLAYLDPLTRAGNGWHPDAALVDRVGEIGGRTVGFLGYGAIPQLLAPALIALGARVIYTANSPKPDLPGVAVSFAELLTHSDILSLHVPLTGATERIIDSAALAAMKPGAVLVNTARGGLVDEAALHAALTSGMLAGAGLDVFGAEPASADNPLFALPNVLVTPHVAWITQETLRRSMIVAFENARRVAQGADLLHRVA
ncbi:D-isomer specific 2-hydroxyacid dehydrogenase family protein [Novosphingobium sp.]|uniref:NAD(P)-dependent oxidoreductase n=1 Tax=Novosphingobium sp. TaxID=1874826 RepID=UPI0027365BBE|nr:2-hydroxyacid dehydrogenase [Novosphingobium sp.]MDP3908569.1 2-hydroxyacid dehydrogenase [Novosphingobium sp.]